MSEPSNKGNTLLIQRKRVKKKKQEVSSEDGGGGSSGKRGGKDGGDKCLTNTWHIINYHTAPNRNSTISERSQFDYFF